MLWQEASFKPGFKTEKEMEKMTNDIIPITDWMRNNLLYIYLSEDANKTGIKSLWLQYYPKLHRRSYSSNNMQLTFNRFVRDVETWGHDYQIYYVQMQKLITELIVECLKLYPDFTLKHMQIYQDKMTIYQGEISKTSMNTKSMYSVYFDDVLISFIIQKGLENKGLEQYLISKSLETENNKLNKNRELNELFDMCKKQFKEEVTQ